MAAEDQKWTRSRRLTAGAWSRSEDPERNHGVIAGAFQIEDVVEAIRDDGQLVVSRDALRDWHLIPLLRRMTEQQSLVTQPRQSH